MATEKLDIVVSVIDKASAEIGAIQSKFKNISDTAKKAGAAFTIAGAAITTGFAIAVKEAAIAEGAMAKFTTVFGDNTEAMLEFVDGLRDEMPVARQEIIQMAGNLQDLIVPLGFSRDAATGMTQEILDLSNKIAAFNDVPVDQVLNAFRSGLTGSSEPLKQFGINISVAALEARALTEGLLEQGQTFNDLDEATRIQVKAHALLAQATENSSDAIAGFEENNNSFIRRSQDLVATFQEFLAVIGGPVLEIVDNLLQKILPILDALGIWIEKNPQLTAQIAIFTAGLGALLLILGPLLLLVPGLVTAFGVLSSAAAILGVSIGVALGWFVLIVAAIAAVVAITLILVKNWDKVKSFFVDTWDTIKDAFVNAVGTIRSFIEDNLGFLITFFEFWWSVVTSIFNVHILVITAVWNAFWNVLVAVVTAVWNVIGAVVTGAFNLLKKGFLIHLAVLKGAWDAVWGAFGPTVTAVFETVKGVVKAGINFIINKINFFIRAVNKLTSAAGGIPGVKIAQLPEIPLLAKGGNITGAGSAIVGEAGPELIDLPRGARVTPLSGGGGGGITVVINNPQILSDEAAVEFGDMIVSNLKKHFATV